MKYLIGLVFLFAASWSFAAASVQCEQSIGGRKTTIVLYQDAGWKMSFNGAPVEKARAWTRSPKADVVRISANNNPKSKTIYEFSGVQKCMCEGKLQSSSAKSESKLNIFVEIDGSRSLWQTFECGCIAE